MSRAVLAKGISLTFGSLTRLASTENDEMPFYLVYLLVPFDRGRSYHASMTDVKNTKIPNRTLLIAGCGYLGCEIVRLAMSREWNVIGLTHTAVSADQLRRDFGIDAYVADLASAKSLHGVAASFGKIDLAIHCASTKGGGVDTYRAVYVDGCANLLAAFSPRRFVFVSSTSVFGQVDGELVDETSISEPASPTGGVLLEAERVALDAGGSVVRLGGIYGPSRSVLLRNFLDGSATIDEGVARVINQIHRDDAADAIMHVAELAGGEVFHVVDSDPQFQPELMEWLAGYFGRDVPPTAPRVLGKRRGWSNKAVSNKKLRASGWSPRYSSFRDAVKNDPRLVSSIQQLVGND